MFESSLNSYSWIGVFAEKIEDLQKIVSKIFQKKGKKIHRCIAVSFIRGSTIPSCSWIFLVYSTNN